MRTALAFLALSGADALNVVDVGAFSASKLLPFENKDAFFVSPPYYCGVFDGVSQCPQSRSFAVTLAKTSCAALSGSRPSGEIMEQMQPVLWNALGQAQDYSGCSTACLVRLDLQQEQPQVSCLNLGDSTCMVLRPSEGAGALTVADVTVPKLHSSGAPYQFGGLKWKTDKTEDAETFCYDVGSGDVVLCYSDGVSNNVKPDEIAAIVNECRGAPAQEMAQRLVETARQRKIVDDDATLVAMRIGEGSGPTAPMLSDEAPWEKVGLRLFG